MWWIIGIIVVVVIVLLVVTGKKKKPEAVTGSVENKEETEVPTEDKPTE